jgi:hypothetical protein
MSFITEICENHYKVPRSTARRLSALATFVAESCSDIEVEN